MGGTGEGAGEDREIGGGPCNLLVAREEQEEGRSMAGGGEEGQMRVCDRIKV